MLSEYIQKLVADGYRVTFDNEFETDKISITLSKDNFRVKNIISSVDLHSSVLPSDNILTQAIQHMEKQFS